MRIQYKEGVSIKGITYLKDIESNTNSRKALFICPLCQREFIATINCVKSGKTASCGCLRKQNNHNRRKYLFISSSSTCSEYSIWIGMRRRCYNQKEQSYSYYGGKGIKVCEQWLNSFEQFYKDMGPRPGKEYSIDRINVTRNYEPKNCRWATKEEQMNNTTKNIFLDRDSKRQTVAQWANELGIKSNTIYHRIYRNKCNIEQILDSIKS